MQEANVIRDELIRETISDLLRDSHIGTICHDEVVSIVSFAFDYADICAAINFGHVPNPELAAVAPDAPQSSAPECVRDAVSVAIEVLP